MKTALMGGTYRLWSRAKADTNREDSYYYGIDGVLDEDNAFDVTGDWVWDSEALEIPAGEHELCIWMREPGVVIEKIVLALE